MVKCIYNADEKAEIARSVLLALPDWFGILEAREEYIRCSRELPFWAAFAENKASSWEAEAGTEALGFIVLKETSPATAEIYVMGVRPEYHRKGIGRLLFQTLYDYAREQGYSFLQVKTVQEGHYREYDLTNQFYKGVGFQELECFPTLWGEENPCQLLIMTVR